METIRKYIFVEVQGKHPKLIGPASSCRKGQVFSLLALFDLMIQARFSSQQVIYLTSSSTRILKISDNRDGTAKWVSSQELNINYYSAVKKGVPVMKRFLLFFLCMTSFAFSQSSNFTDYFNARFAKTIGLGNAYTGCAEGVEAVFYNPAGIANINSYVIDYSLRDGYAWLAKANPNDFAFAAPVSIKLGSIALSRHQLSFDYRGINSHSRIYSFIYARKLLKPLSVGVILNYYNYHSQMATPPSADVPRELNIDLFDIGLSFLYKKDQINHTNWNDSFGFGLFFNNLIDSKHKYSSDYKEPKAQYFRAGLSYSLSPFSQRIHQLNPLNITFNFDASFFLLKYSFYLWQPDYGIQATVFDYFALRFGRQSEFLVREHYDYSPQFPVNRFGLGLILPISDLLKSQRRIQLVFDYAYSDWNQIDESVGNQFFGLDRIDRNAYSFKLRVGL